jgi:hypothetical protein
MLRHWIFLSLLGCSAFGGAIGRPAIAQEWAPMLNPGIDNQPGPFSYFSHSVDEIGAMDAPMATEITPEASLYTGYGELVFLVGPEMSTIAPRIRTLEKATCRWSTPQSRTPASSTASRSSRPGSMMTY